MNQRNSKKKQHKIYQTLQKQIQEQEKKEKRIQEKPHL